MKKCFNILLVLILLSAGFSAVADELLTRTVAADLVVRSGGFVAGDKAPLDVLSAQGIMSKSSTQKYLTRAEAIALLCRAGKIEVKSGTSSRFSDVPLNSWSSPYITTAEQLGWLTEFEGSFFFPKKVMTKQEFEKLLLKQKTNKSSVVAPVVATTVAPLKKTEVLSKGLVSLSFQNMETAQVLQLLARESGLNIILAENVRGKISGHFKNVLPETVLVNIVQSAGCSYIQDGNLYRVFKPVAPTPKSTNVREFKLNYADGDSVVKELTKLIPSLEGKVILTKGSNTILISSRHPQLGLARDIIQSLDVPPLQVMVEAKIFEVGAEESSKLGTKFIGTEHNNVNSKTFESFNLEPADKAIYIRSVDRDVQAYVSALEAKSDFNMLSSPKVIVVNNREAVLETTEEVAYQDETVSYTTVGEVISKKLIFKNVGTKLKLIPHINEKGFITIDLYPEISSSVVDASTSYPLTHTTKAHTQVVVKDGETFLIGGLLRDKKEKVTKKVPLLGDIPLVGLLFKRTEEQTVKKDIIIMITPTIIDPFSVKK